MLANYKFYTCEYFKKLESLVLFYVFIPLLLLRFIFTSVLSEILHNICYNTQFYKFDISLKLIELAP